MQRLQSLPSILGSFINARMRALPMAPRVGKLLADGCPFFFTKGKIRPNFPSLFPANKKMEAKKKRKENEEKHKTKEKIYRCQDDQRMSLQLMREPGLEPGSHAWEACMLTATLSALRQCAGRKFSNPAYRLP